MCDKKVSIIVPIYNAEKRLEKCIKSIQNQTYSNIEIILVNDGSSDSSLDICNRFARQDSRIHVINIDNSGVSLARNKGIDYAKGTYCCFVDADDWIEENHIENMMVHADEADCVIEGYVRERISGQYKCYLQQKIIDLNKLDGKQVGEMFWNGYIHPCWNKLFKRKILVENNIYFEHQIHISEDSLFCIKYLSYCNSMEIINATTYHYWIDECNLSLSKKVYPDIFDIYMKVYNELSGLLERGNCEENVKNEILIRTIYPQLYSAISKILINDKISRSEKKNILKNIEKTSYCEQVLCDAKQLSNNNIEKIILFFIVKKKYMLVEIVWKFIGKKSR